MMSAAQLSAEFHTGGKTQSRSVSVSSLIVAGWTGRDAEALEKHIRELEELGVARPASVPIFYRVAASRLTTSPIIEVSGNDSSGEVEFVLLQSGGQLWVGLGSDHTDRKVETYNVTVSKQMCEKPVAASFWAYADVAPHWDRLILRSYIEEHGDRVLYQEGPVTAMRAPEDLIHRFSGGSSLPDDSLMFCGTLAARGGIRSSRTFMLELADPVLNRTIMHRYDMINLPVMG